MNTCCAAVILLALFVGFSSASSIYVKSGYRAGMRATELGPGEAVSARVCEDSNVNTCQRIQQWFRARACSTEDPVWTDTMKQICAKTCGFCDCKDKYEAMCREYTHLCNNEGDLGNFMKEICAKTCGTCTGETEVVPYEAGHQ